MRFLHTADWQIGMKASHVSEGGIRIRDKRIATVRNLVEVAKENNVEFMLVAGDIFEDNGVNRVLVQKVADILADSNVPVYVIPGNHDPLVPGSVWDHPVWKSTENVFVLRQENPVEVPGGVLYPCPVYEKHSGKDPTKWILTSELEGIRIGMAHGTVDGIPSGDPDFPIPRDAATRSGLDYLALGHWHSTATYAATDKTIRMAYSGTHETTRFGERDSGNVLIVEIPNAGVEPQITTVRTGGLEWQVLNRELRQPGDLSQLREEIESMKNPSSTLLELGISGILSANEYPEINRIQEIVSSRFLYSHIDETRVRPSPEDENWIAVLPIGIIRETGIRLQQLTDPNFAGERPEGASPDVASRALVELYAIITEATQ